MDEDSDNRRANVLKTCLRITKITFSRIWRSYKGLYRGKWYKKAVTGIATFIVCFVLYLLAVSCNFLWLFGKSPSMDSIMHPETNEASLLYSADGKLIGKYFNENRTPVTYEEINPVFFDALIDTEDERFYSHHGIDFPGLIGAFKDMLQGNARGGSTITQQLVKNMYRVRTQYSTGLLGKIPGLKIVIMKSKEWIIATQLEMFYSKKDILTMYANTVDFGSNAFGIKTAAKTYFNTTPTELTTEQAAVLVGLLRATSHYNPKLNPKNSFTRRNVVLDNMVKHKHLTRVQYDSLSAIPIELKYKPENAYDGQALYFRQAVASSLREWCNESGYDLYVDGLKIHTTLDTRMQEYAECAVHRHMQTVQNNFNNHWGKSNPWRNERYEEIPNFIENIAKKTEYYRALNKKYDGNVDSIFHYLNKPHRVRLFDYENGVRYEEMSTMDSIRYMVRFIHTGFVAMEPANGHVKAWVGDIDFDSWKYDKVTAMRQPGSTFKLFVYAAAINNGLTPCDRRIDSYVEVKTTDENGKPTVWRPHNAKGYFTEDTMYLKSAFAQSVNSIAVKLGLEVGIPEVIKTAKAMGIKSRLDNAPSLSLGPCDVTLLELVNAYCTAVNDGYAHEPVLVTRIEDRNGKVIYTAREEQKQALPYRTAFLMQQMLLGGMTEPGGTTMALWGYVGAQTAHTEFGGKTGTSNNHSDAWFVGVTPKLVAGAWVGGEYRSIHFRTGELGQGSRTALPICGYFFKDVLSDDNFKHYQGKFGKPKEKINPADYSCRGCLIEQADSDSISLDGAILLDIDSLGHKRIVGDSIPNDSI